MDTLITSISDARDSHDLTIIRDQLSQMHDLVNKKYAELANKVIVQVPADIWIMIFNIHQRSMNVLCKMRLVCKIWEFSIAFMTKIRINYTFKTLEDNLYRIQYQRIYDKKIQQSFVVLKNNIGNKFKLLTSLELRGSIHLDLSQFHNLKKLIIFNRPKFNSKYCGFHSLVNLTHLTYKYANKDNILSCVNLPITHLNVSHFPIEERVLLAFKSLTHLTLEELSWGAFRFPKIPTLKQLTIIGWNISPIHNQTCHLILIEGEKRFSGDIDNGQIIGIGTTNVYTNGASEKYIGEHKFDNIMCIKYHGYGTLEKNGVTYKGEFINGELCV